MEQFTADCAAQLIGLNSLFFGLINGSVNAILEYTSKEPFRILRDVGDLELGVMAQSLEDFIHSRLGAKMVDIFFRVVSFLGDF
jgi:hypothetical protein